MVQKWTYQNPFVANLAKLAKLTFNKNYTVAGNVGLAGEMKIVSMNMTDCIECPTTTWPDETVTECLPIEPTYLLWSDSLVHCLAVLGLLGILASFIIAGAFIVHRDTKLVKASSRELSSIILGGIFLAYVSVFFLPAETIEMVLCSESLWILNFNNIDLRSDACKNQQNLQDFCLRTKDNEKTTIH